MNIIIESRAEIVRVLETYLDIILESLCLQTFFIGQFEASETTEVLPKGALRQEKKQQRLKN